MKARTLTYAVSLALMLGSGTAAAFSLPPGIGTTAGAQAEDNDLDFLVDNDENGLISQGDQLVAPYEFAAINDILAANGTTATQPLNQDIDELVGVATLTVSNVATDGAGDVTRVDFTGNADGTPALQVYSVDSVGDVNLDIGSYANCTDLLSCTAAATDGAHWADFDFADGDDEWFFSPVTGFGSIADDPSAIAGLGASTKFGAANFALSLTNNSSSFTFVDQYIGCASVPDGVFQCADDGLTTLVGSADILGGNGLPDSILESGGFARTDTDVQVNTVPEPGVVALLGMGLLGMGLGGLRRKR